MNFVKLLLDQSYGNYSPKEASDDKMFILGFFLTDDLGFYDDKGIATSFKDWALNDSLGYCVSGNITCLTKDNDTIILSDLFEEEDGEVSEVLKMSRLQFAKLFDDWKEKVCELMPKEVIIKYENDEFIIETKE